MHILCTDLTYYIRCIWNPLPRIQSDNSKKNKWWDQLRLEKKHTVHSPLLCAGMALQQTAVYEDTFPIVLAV